MSKHGSHKEQLRRRRHERAVVKAVTERLIRRPLVTIGLSGFYSPLAGHISNGKRVA